MRSRIQEVDFVKGMAIMAVVVLHISYTFEDAVARPMLGGMWHVPVFFLVGGFFCYADGGRGDWKGCWEFVKHKIRTLYVPATICYVLAMMGHNLFVHIGWYPLGHPSPSTGEPFVLWDTKDYAIQMGKALLGYGEPIMGAMWFVYVLLFAHIGLMVLKTLLGRGWTLWTLLFGLQIASWYLSNRMGLTIPRVNNTVTAMFMLQLGGWAFQHWEWGRKWWMALLAMVVYLASAVWCGNVVLNKNWYHDPIMLNLTAVAVLILLYQLYHLLKQTFVARTIAYIGCHSYAIMAGQVLGFYLCTSLLWLHYRHIPMGGYTAVIDERHWFVGVAYVVMGVAVPLLIAKIINSIENKMGSK